VTCCKDDDYILGYRHAELDRLQRQSAQLSDDSARLFDAIGIGDGARVLEIGCGPTGCLEMLSTRVGESGRVVGIEINAESVARAQAFVTRRGLSNVEVKAADARATGLPRHTFDFVVSRLVLVNIPRPEQVIAEAISLARPGGVVGFHEVDGAGLMCDPPSQAWSDLVEMFKVATETNGNDWHFGRRLPGLLRQSGVTDIEVNPIMRVYAAENPRRSLLVDFVDNFRDRVLAVGRATENDLQHLKQALLQHVQNPDTIVFDGLYVQAWGRTPV